jgi:hypothetical protein
LSRKTAKIGFQSGRQRFKCFDCGAKFQDHKREKTRTQAKLWHEYVWGKQNLQELSETHHKSIPWIHEQLRKHDPSRSAPTPQPIVLIADGFFFRVGVGVMLFRAAHLHQNIYWFSIGWETIGDYVKGIDYLEQQGWLIQALVCDGRRGVKEAFKSSYPIQMCQFHQVKIVTKHLTTRPQLPASIALRSLALTLAHTNEVTFNEHLTAWYATWAEFLKERTIDSETGRWFYTHKRVRSAYRSLKENLPYLFTYQKYPELNIPNTTNSLDGSISHLRDKLRAHRGLKLTQRIKITGELLRGKYPKKLH